MPDQPQQYQPQNIYPNPGQESARTISEHDTSPAVDMIRNKIDSLYATEPSPLEDKTPAPQPVVPASKHQQYIASLQASGMSLVDVQNAWHVYYAGLPEAEKYQVWQEFYVQQSPAQAAQPQQPQQPRPTAQAMPSTAIASSQPTAAAMPTPAPVGAASYPTVQQAGYDYEYKPEELPQNATLRDRAATRNTNAKLSDAAKRLTGLGAAETANDIKQRIVNLVKQTASGGDGKKSSPIHSLLFGLGCGAIVIFILMFSFFNELVIAPFVQPSRKATETPVIVNTADAVVSTESRVIIPKINLEIPVDYSQTTTSEKAIELALDNGVVHYPTTVKPGETGNAAFFGHSSNNIFNPGKYKFAFVLLHELEEGDTFYLTRDGKVYAYRVFSKRIVQPTQVDVLDPVAGHPATATLITCDPPGTSINRLVVVGDQISPDPNTNSQSATQVATSATQTAASSAGLPGNGPSLWSRIVNSIF